MMILKKHGDSSRNMHYSNLMLFSTLLLFLMWLGNENSALADVITDLSATTILDQHSVLLRWTAPATSPDNPIVDYVIRYKTSKDNNFLIFDDGVNLNTSVLVTGLAKGTSYDFRVTAIKTSGQINSQLVSVTTPRIATLSTSTPKIAGIGFYVIKTDTPIKPYANGEITRFDKFFHYSHFSDKVDQKNYGKFGYEKRGQYFNTDEYETSVPTLLAETNQNIQLQVRIVDPVNSTKIEHLALYANIRSKNSEKQFSNTYIIYEKGSPLELRDPNGFFKNIKVTSSIEGENFWLIYDMVFKRPMKKSDIILESWNDSKTPSYAKIVDALEVSEPKQQKTLEEKISFGAEIEITHDASSPVCRKDNSCFVPYKAKVFVDSTVTWTNTDSFIHTVNSGIPGKEGKTSSFEAIVFPGKSFSATFQKPGSYQYYCKLHPWAQGLISVYESEDIPPISILSEKPALIIKSVTAKGSLLIENSDTVYLENRSLKIEIFGHVQDSIKGKLVQITIKKPDKSVTKLQVLTNEKGYYDVPVWLDKKWQPGSYTVIAKYQKYTLGAISFVIRE